MSIRILLVSAASNLAAPDEEVREIREILRPLEEQGRVDVEEIRNAETIDIINHLRDHKRGFDIFHFAGHANNSSLHFQDQNGNAEGLANLFRDHKNLAVVFLNACSTKEQVDNFLRAGAASVIGTTSEIDDASAKKFAVEFYKGLAREWSVSKSFDYAVAAAQFSGNFAGQNTKVIVPRGTGFATSDTQMLPWGLYTTEELSEKALNWSFYTRRARLKYLVIALVGIAVIASIFWATSNTDPKPESPVQTGNEQAPAEAQGEQPHDTQMLRSNPTTSPKTPTHPENPGKTVQHPAPSPPGNPGTNPGQTPKASLIINRKDLEKNKIDFSISNPFDFPLTVTEIYLSEKQKAMNLGNVQEIKRKELGAFEIRQGSKNTSLIKPNATLEIAPKRTGTFSFRYQSVIEKAPGTPLQFLFKEKNQYDSTFLKVGEYFLEVEYINIFSGDTEKMERYLFDRVTQ